MYNAKKLICPGRFISFEGIDRAGKTTAVARLKTTLSTWKPVIICGEFQSPIGPKLKELLAEGTSSFSKTFLFAADRAVTYESIGLPALRRGELVLWDRYVDTAIAYRTVEFKRAKPESIDLDFVWEINEPFIQPDLIIYIDISVATSVKRARLSGSVEPYAPDFLEEVREEYRKLASLRNYAMIDGEQSADDVVKEIETIIHQRFQGI